MDQLRQLADALTYSHKTKLHNPWASALMAGWLDRRLNAVILFGSPHEIAATRDFKKQLDVPLPSVMLECEVVELSESTAHYWTISF